MAKRFIDTGLYDDDWFMELSKDAKLLWVYFITKCDHAGMLKMNEKLCKLQTSVKNIPETIKELGDRLLTVSEQLYFIPKFIEFQYPGFPKSGVRQQDSAIEILKRYNLFDENSLKIKKELANSYLTLNKELGKRYEHEHEHDNGNGNGRKEKAEKIEKKKFIPPLMPDVISYFLTNGYTEEAARKAFNYYNEAGWKDSRGNKIQNWKQKMIAVWFKPENAGKGQERKRDYSQDKQF